MKKQPRKPRHGRVLINVMYVLQGMMLAYCARIIESFLDVGGFSVRLVLVLMMVPVVLLMEYLMTLVHEAGHMLGGWLSGRRFAEISVGGWTLMKRGGRLRWGYDATPGAAGQCAMVTDKSPAPFVIYGASGAVVTLLLGCVCAFFAVRTYPSWELSWEEALPLAVRHIPLTMAAVLGVLDGLRNLIPRDVVAGMNDGMRLRLLRRDERCRAAIEQAERIAWEEYQGRTLPEMPEALFVHPAVSRDMNQFEVQVAVLRLARLLEQREFAVGLSLCRELLAAEVSAGPLQRMYLVRTGALCEALLDGPGELCRRMQDRDIERLMHFSRRTRGTLLCRYAMAKLVSRDEMSAARYLADYEKAVQRSPSREEICRGGSLIRVIDERAAALQAADGAGTQPA